MRGQWVLLVAVKIRLNTVERGDPGQLKPTAKKGGSILSQLARRRRRWSWARRSNLLLGCATAWQLVETTSCTQRVRFRTIFKPVDSFQ